MRVSPIGIFVSATISQIVIPSALAGVVLDNQQRTAAQTGEEGRESRQRDLKGPDIHHSWAKRRDFPLLNRLVDAGPVRNFPFENFLFIQPSLPNHSLSSSLLHHPCVHVRGNTMSTSTLMLHYTRRHRSISLSLSLPLTLSNNARSTSWRISGQRALGNRSKNNCALR